MISQLVSRLMGKAAMWAVDHFYELGRVGGAIPEGPVLVIANHPNSVVDGIVVMRIAGRRVRPLARAPLFDQALFGHALRGLGALPVYRPQDYPGETWRNEDTFRAAVDALLEAQAVLIFPEGLSHSAVRLSRIKTGAARIALQAEDEAGWRLGLRIVPVGLTYHRKHAFRGRAAAVVGVPFKVLGWRDLYRQDEWEAVESLSTEIRQALEKVILNLPAEEDRELIEAAEQLYATEKGWKRPRERARLAQRLPRLQRFSEGLSWLHAEHPERYAQLKATVSAYRKRLALLGVAEGDLPERFAVRNVLLYTVVQGAILLVGLPFAVLGTLAWYLPYQSPRISLRFYRPAYEVIATVKLVTAILAFPVTYLIWLGLTWWIAGPLATLAVALLLPVAGLIALRWRDRWSIVREDARIFRRAVGRHSLRRQLMGRRELLVREFDEVAGLWMSAQAVRARSGGPEAKPPSD